MKLKLPVDPKLIIGAVLVLVISGGVAYFVANKVISSKEKKTKQPEVVNMKPGPVVKLGDFTVNLADRDETHFVRVSIALEVRDSTIETLVKKDDWSVRIKNAIIMILRDKKTTDLSTSKGISNVAREIKFKLNSIIPKGKVNAPPIRNVFFTSFMVQ